jgi:two-component system OmpR family response regulator
MTAQEDSSMPNILLVDDVYMARSMAERVLKHVGRYTVHSVANGAEAIEAALANTPDLVILDISMAGMDGITVLQKLRESGVACPAIAFTARSEKVPGEFKNHGFNAYVSKTGDLSSLLETVRAVLSSRTRATSSYTSVA